MVTIISIHPGTGSKPYCCGHFIFLSPFLCYGLHHTLSNEMNQVNTITYFRQIHITNFASLWFILIKNQIRTFKILDNFLLVLLNL